MTTPKPKRVSPNVGDPGDIFTVVITGDVLANVVQCDFGEGIDTSNLKVLGDGGLTVKLTINPKSPQIVRDVTLTDKAGISGVISGGFQVL